MDEGKNRVLVIGGGIAGISAALDLADQGHEVVMVEKGPTIGGQMAKLDKTFPTLDCSICILSPKMVEVSRHPRIRLLTCSELEEVVEDEGGFTVKILSRPRYVDEAKCTGCGICMESCPSNDLPNEFNEGLDNRTAIWVPFPQAVPRTALIEPDCCLMIREGKCGVCRKKCPAEAVDFSMTGSTETIDVSSIVVATGFEVMDPTSIWRYGFWENENVITAIQLERMLNASGPTEGHVLRPTDGQEPRKIAFVLCAGSRDVSCKEYCSKICCMYSAKDAMLVKDHVPEAEVSIFYNDLRALGNGGEDFIDRASATPGISYRRGLPAQVQGVGIGNLDVRFYDGERGEITDQEFEMVVLFTPILPSSGIGELASKLGIELDENGFVRTIDDDNVSTTRDRIFVCGCAKGPEDIPTSVTEGMAAAAKAASISDIGEKDAVSETPMGIIQEMPPRIGVYVCSCGSNIGGVVDVEEVARFAAELPDVVHSRMSMYTCSEDTQEMIQKDIEERGLNRVLIAACSPRSHLSLFRDTAHVVGLNPGLVGLVSLREMDSWVHIGEPEEATEKAKTIVRMGVANMRHAMSASEIEQEVEPVAMIIGGGVAGMSAALAISSSGYRVVLAEKEARLGGSTSRRLLKDIDGTDLATLVQRLREDVMDNEAIEVLTSHIPVKVKGSVGSFEVQMRKTMEGASPDLERIVRNVGTIILATGAMDLEPRGYYLHGKDDRVVSQVEFENMLTMGDVVDGTVVQILCVGARGMDRDYCSMTCCETAFRDMIHLKRQHPGAKIYVLFRDIRLSGLLEKYYTEASTLGIRFIRYQPEHPPEVEGDRTLEVTVRDIDMDVDIRIDADILVLSQPLVPNPDNKVLSEIMKIPVSQDGFLLEAHPKLRPVDSFTDGIFMAGTAQGPKGIGESMAQGLAAASRALVPLMRGRVMQEPTVAIVDPDLCTGCARCVEVCPYGSMGMRMAEYQVEARVDSMLCKGCGKCVVACPSRAVTVVGFTDDQMLAQIDEANSHGDGEEVRAVAFLCNWCAYAGADNAGVSRFQYPSNVMPIRVMCSGRVDPLHVLYALLSGADGVLIGGCHIGDCHYVSGNEIMQRKVERLRSMVEDYGFDPRRIRVEWISASEGKKFADVVTEFVEDLERIGPNPLRQEKEKEVA